MTASKPRRTAGSVPVGKHERDPVPPPAEPPPDDGDATTGSEGGGPRIGDGEED